MNFVLVDYENVPVTSLALLKGAQFRVRVFLGPNNTKLPVPLALAMQELGDRAAYMTLESSGNNALDFQIAYYLGTLSTLEPTASFYIISKDTGFDPLIQHLRRKNINAARSASIEEMSCFVAPDLHTSEKKVVTTSKAGGSSSIPSRAAQKMSRDVLLQKAISNLAGNKTSRPRTVKTLRSTIHAICGKDLPGGEIDAVYKSLLKYGYVKAEGTKVSYSFPEQLGTKPIPLRWAGTPPHRSESGQH